MTKIEWLKLLHDKRLIWNDEAFTLTDQDIADGLTSVDEKLNLEYTGDYEDNYAEVRDGNKEITIMKGPEGIDKFVKDKIRYLEADELINIIRQMPGGLKSVLENVWNWKLQEDGEYTVSVARTASLNVPKLLRLADRLDKKGLFVEANELDSLITAHCGHCSTDKKKKKKQLKKALLVKAVELGDVQGVNFVDSFRRVLDRFQRNETGDFSPEEVKNLFANLANKSPREIVEYLDLHQTNPLASQLIEFLSRFYLVKDPLPLD